MIKFILFSILFAVRCEGQTPTALYAGTSDDVYKSIDGGKTWQPTHLNASVPNNFGLPTVAATEIVVDPVFNSLVLVSTAAAVYRSVDAGGHWQLSNSGLPAGVSITCMAVDYRQRGLVYLGTGGSGIYRSTTYGAQWEQTTLTSGFITALTTHPQRAGTVYATTSNGLTSTGSFGSADSGATWTPLFQGTATNATLNVGSFGQIGVDPKDSTIYLPLEGACTAGSQSTSCGLFKSTDDGKTWQSTGVPTPMVNMAFSGGAAYAAGSNSPFAGHIIRSTDAGNTWTAANSGLTCQTAEVFADPASPTMYAACMSTVKDYFFVSTDAGATWRKSDAGLPSKIINFGIPRAVVGPSISGILNAASFQGGPVAPGEIVTLFGSGIGPSDLISLQLGTDGLVTTTLGQTQVLFDGKAAPLIYVRSDQTAAVVPYAVAGNSTTQLQVTYTGVVSAVMTVPVAASAPGIFSIDSSGKGPGAVLNADGSINSPSNPAKAGSVVSIFATGEGLTTPSGTDGKVASDMLPKPVLPVSVRIGNQVANVQYAGGAPGAVAGLLQINANVPATVAVGPAVPVVLTVGTASSQAGITIAVSQ